MADALEYLNRLIYLPPDPNAGRQAPLKPIVENVEAIARGEMPEGIDIEAIVMEAMMAQDQVPDTSAMEAAIEGSVNFAVTNRTQLQDIANRFTSAGQAELGAMEEQNMNTAELAQSQLGVDIDLDADIRNLLRERDDQRDATSAEFNQVVSQIAEDTQFLQETGGINVMDFINNPLSYMNTIMERNAVEERVAASTQLLNTLDAKEKFNARLTQEETADINIARALRRHNDEGLLLRGIETSRILADAQAKKQFSVDQFSNLKESLNINNTALGNMVTGLNALQEGGKLTQQKLSNAINAAQALSLNTQMKQQAKLVERDEAVRGLFDYRIRMAAEALGVSDTVKDYDTFVAARENEFLPVDTLSSISYAMSVGVLDSRAIFNSSKPMNTAKMLMSTDSSLMTDDVINLIARADSILYDGRSSVQSDPNYVNMTPAEREAAQNSALSQFFQNAKNDGGLYVDNGLLALKSPHSLDYSPGMGLDNIPAATVPILQKMRVDSRDLNLFANDMAANMADAALNAGVSTEQLAIAASQVMTLHAQDLRNRTGLGTEGLIVTKFGGPSRADVTNPVEWKNRIEQMVAVKKATQLGRINTSNF